MARCHRPEWLAAVPQERLMTEQRLATAKGHHSQLTVEKGKAHIRLSFGRRWTTPPGPSSYKIETRWRGRKWGRFGISISETVPMGGRTAFVDFVRSSPRLTRGVDAPVSMSL